ncbi:M24 family metallopeptidase [Caulifigura coniformis]|nr:Xaa-Pro peptidase family protein [Caulifigura coniformis]
MTNDSNRPAERRERLQQVLERAGLSAMLVTSEINVRYLTGFTGDSTYLLLDQGRPLLISDRRYETQLAEECPGVDSFIRPPDLTLPLAAAQALAKAGGKKFGFDPHSTSFALYTLFKEQAAQATLVPVEGLVEGLRAVKDADEIAEIRRAVDLAIEGINALKPRLTSGRTERECAWELEATMRCSGAAGFAFAPIIAVGDRAAMPHYHAGDRLIGESPLILVDWGAETHSCYRSDLTRTFFTGRPGSEMERVYEVVLEAQRQAIAAIRPGVAGKAVDAIARKVIAEAGYGELGHGLGHGFGLEIHEQPRLAPNFPHVLEANMVVTVEPAIYIRGQFGVRIEDDVLVTPDGCEVLSRALPSDWESAQIA